jgi:NTP pyrophosphatase (non-canonical NTP hydrolase)
MPVSKVTSSEPKPHNPKDILCSIVGEIGELRNAVKLEEDMEILKEDLEDNINDVYWLAALFANGNGIVFEEVIAKIEEMKKKS